jgi:hypothetical protein
MPHNLCDERKNNWMPEKILWRELKTNLAPQDFFLFSKLLLYYKHAEYCMKNFFTKIFIFIQKFTTNTILKNVEEEAYRIGI